MGYHPPCTARRDHAGSCTRAQYQCLPVIYLLFGDKAHAPATVHDYLYHVGIVPRKLADDVFSEAMKASTKLSAVERFLMWSAVRVFGGVHYGEKA